MLTTQSTAPWQLHQDIIILGLLFQCLCDDPACPLAEVHPLPPRERIAWADNLSVEERTGLLNHYYMVRAQLDALLHPSPLPGLP